MIIRLTGKVKYPLTLDPTVWIFDDRKIIFESAFSDNEETDEEVQEDLHWDRTVYQQKIKPPINKSLTRAERKQALENSYVMPIADFLHTAEIQDDAAEAVLITDEGEKPISLSELNESLFLFAVDGKTVKDRGPAHCYLKTNPSEPIKAVTEIQIR